MNGVIVPQNQCGAKSQKGFITSSFWQISVDFCRRKKARKACAVRAFRTSSDDSGNHRWRILGWRPCDWMFKPLIFILIFYLYSIGGSKKEP
ncbi:hypothetical protein NE321_12350 [Salmonella enterica subsp. indica serovar 11:b:e,n,x]|nr:hypothetical protein [Salmonella enterica subsp. indica serovar 11:b:e,n,x]HBC0166905.1 hypothetical protein [Salmonella enterica subsp. indica]